MSLSHRLGRLEAAAKRSGHGRAVARIWLQPEWDALSDAARADEKVAIILPDNGREAHHHAG